MDKKLLEELENKGYQYFKDEENFISTDGINEYQKFCAYLNEEKKDFRYFMIESYQGIYGSAFGKNSTEEVDFKEFKENISREFSETIEKIIVMHTLIKELPLKKEKQKVKVKI